MGLSSNAFLTSTLLNGDWSMYTLIRNVTKKQLLLEQAPALFVSLVIAEIFYKLGSFTLECIAFLATWFVVDVLYQFILQVRKQ